MKLACLVLVALGACASPPAEAPIIPPARILWRVICDLDDQTVRIDLGSTGPGVWTLSGDELACTHRVPTT